MGSPSAMGELLPKKDAAALARADQRVHTQVAREAGVLQGGTVMLRQRLEQAFENQTAFRIGVFGLALAPVLMVLAVLFVD
jgi:hypothetical protein